MPAIVEEHPYNGANERITRLGLTPILEELRTILTGFSLRVEEKRDANGGAAVRRLMAARADDLPILLIAIEHDGAGPALAKQAKRPRKKP